MYPTAWYVVFCFCVLWCTEEATSRVLFLLPHELDAQLSTQQHGAKTDHSNLQQLQGLTWEKWHMEKG